uniref:Nucleoside-diphosphate kinase n=1 Tax=Sphenodon punctatus TaxID=8508 RepID=A0A8D0HBV9_SPHPU
LACLTLSLLRFLSAEKLQSPAIVFVIGGPGSGKATQSALLAEKYNLHHVGIGELLRDESTKGNAKAKAIRDIMLKGALVPSGYVLDLLVENMATKQEIKGFIISGFPRELCQAKEFERVVSAPLIYAHNGR